MESVLFVTHKVADKLPLGTLAEYFRLPSPTRWREYIKIEESQLDTVLKYSVHQKAVYAFTYGCITFVNFDQDETYSFLEFLQSLVGALDFKMLHKYSESHRMELYADGNCSLWANGDESMPWSSQVADITAIVLAKSTEFYKVEVELSNLLDEAEIFIAYLQKGRLRSNAKKVASALSKIIRFKYMSLESIRIFDRPAEADRTLLSRRVYDEMANYYELEDRYEIVRKQMDDLQSLAGTYFSLGSNQTEHRLLWLEVFLLALFPLFHAAEHLAGTRQLDVILNLLK